MPSAKGHQTVFRKDGSAQFGSSRLETRSGPCDPHREPLFYVVLASRNFNSQEVNEMMKYGGGEREVEEGANRVRRKED